MNARIDLPTELLAEGQDPGPAFEPFSWTAPEADEASTLGQLKAIKEARDIAAGVASVVAMLESEELNEGCDYADGRPIPKLFPIAVRGNLQRLAVTSLEMLTDRLDKAINQANELAKRKSQE